MDEIPSIPGLDDENGSLVAAVWNAPDARLITLIKAGRLDPKKDFVRRDLRGWPLTGQDVRGIDFTGSDLRGTGIEYAIRDETTILTHATRDETPPPPPQTKSRNKMIDNKQPSKEGKTWNTNWHWHAGVHKSFGNKLYLIRLRFISGSIFVKDSIVKDLHSSGISDYMIFNLYSPWDIAIRAWADDKSIEILKENFKDNGEVDQVERKPEFLEISEIYHLPDQKKKYPSHEEVRAVLTKIPTDQLIDVQEKGKWSAFFSELTKRGLILENEIRWTNRRIQFYISIERTRIAQEHMLKTLLRVVGESQNIYSRTIYSIAGGDLQAIVKGQVLPSNYYAIHDFLKSLTKELQEALSVYIKTETTLVANQYHSHSALIDFSRAIRQFNAFDLSPASETIPKGEDDQQEFKSTLRVNLRTGQNDPRMEFEVLKTIAAFVNSEGGTLIIGVDDKGKPVVDGAGKPIGIQADKFDNEDKMNRHLGNLIASRIGAHHMIAVRPRFDDYEGVRVMVVKCTRSPAPVFIKDGIIDHFFIRTGAATREIIGSDRQEFIKHHFR